MTAANALIEFGRDLKTHMCDLFPTYRAATETIASVIVAAFQRDCIDSMEIISVMQELTDICTYTPAEQGTAISG